jgi:hypothetical protein
MSFWDLSVKVLHGLRDQFIAEDLGDLADPRLLRVEVQNPHSLAGFERQDVLSVEVVPMALLSFFCALWAVLAHLRSFQMASTVF